VKKKSKEHLCIYGFVKLIRHAFSLLFFFPSSSVMLIGWLAKILARGLGILAGKWDTFGFLGHDSKSKLF